MRPWHLVAPKLANLGPISRIREMVEMSGSTEMSPLRPLSTKGKGAKQSWMFLRVYSCLGVLCPGVLIFGFNGTRCHLLAGRLHCRR